jgi:formamidopyrimidine-DNA glycosylase
MPELPEVEIVKRELSQSLAPNAKFEGVEVFRKNLRFAIPVKPLQKIVGEKLLSLERKAKYITWNFESGLLATHLGMTGKWHNRGRVNTHDHLTLKFSGQLWTYEDPRRFGFIEFYKSFDEFAGKRLQKIGFDVLQEEVDFDYLLKTAKSRKVPIKSFLMNQEALVGVGNIYASEILFRARISPMKPAQSLKLADWQLIASLTKSVFSEAISRGGSTISNFKSAYGEAGSFQNFHLVYGRENDECVVCDTKIKSKVIAGRSTFWCPKCQPVRKSKKLFLDETSAQMQIKGS